MLFIKNLTASTSREHSDSSGNTWHWSVFPGGSSKYIPVLTRRQAIRLTAIVATCIMAVLLVYQWTRMSEEAGAGVVNIHESGADTKQLSGISSEAEPRPQRGNIKQLVELDNALLPASNYVATSERGRRLIFIGDIHGCYDELMQLLSEAEYDPATDHIVAAGDMVNKGPHSARVVDFLISRGASCVRGNHDDRILTKYAMEVPAHIPGAPEDPEMGLAKSLMPAQVAYLESCPIILRVGLLPSYGNVLVVHGGLVPSLELIDQDPISVMNMRIIDPLTHIPSKEHDREGHMPWAEFWNQEQSQAYDPSRLDSLANRHPGTTVIYGHDAKRGLQIQKYTKGLDSGCVKGRKLSALVLDSKSDEKVIQVQCKKYA